MALGSEGLLPGAVCPNCGSVRLIPLAFDTHGDRAEIRKGSDPPTPDVKCVNCGARFELDLTNAREVAPVPNNVGRGYHVAYDAARAFARISFHPGTTCGIDLALSAAAEIAAVAGDKGVPLLMDVRQLAGITRDAREQFADAASAASAIALLIESSVSSMIANFFLGMPPPHVPMRLFQSEAEAVVWLGEAAFEDDATSRALTLLGRLAKGELTARAKASGADDKVDAIIVGMNMLAEELQANRDLLDRRVAARTVELSRVNGRLLQESQRRLAIEAELQLTNRRLQLSVGELERLNSGISQVTELGNLLQACETPEEAYGIISDAGNGVFERLSGALYVYNTPRTVLEMRAHWGEPASANTMLPADCLAVQSGRPYALAATSTDAACRHITTRTGSSICLPLTDRTDTIGVLFVTGHGREQPDAERDLHDDARRLAVMVAEEVELAITNIQLRQRLRLQALRDPLTDLYNRRFLEEWLSKEANRAERAGSPLGILMLDVDFFKGFNDAHGHEAGDRLLAEIAEVLRQNVRSGDLVCRYGGEEFLILCPGAELSTAALRAEQLRAGVAQMRPEHAGGLTGVTVSIGVAVFPEQGGDPLGVIHAADTALYTAKRSGRNRVEIASTGLTGRGPDASG